MAKRILAFFCITLEVLASLFAPLLSLRLTFLYGFRCPRLEMDWGPGDSIILAHFTLPLYLGMFALTGLLAHLFATNVIKLQGLIRLSIVLVCLSLLVAATFHVSSWNMQSECERYKRDTAKVSVTMSRYYPGTLNAKAAALTRF